MDEDHIESPIEPADGLNEETVDGLPVLADVRPIVPAARGEPAPPAPLRAVQAAAVAATGFVAGAATVALVKRRAARKLGRAPAPAFRRGGEDLPGLGSGRTFLVHVRVIGRPVE